MRSPRSYSSLFQSLFTRFDVVSCRELMLGADRAKLRFRALSTSDDDSLTLRLRPQQYATLECTIRPH